MSRRAVLEQRAVVVAGSVPEAVAGLACGGGGGAGGGRGYRGGWRRRAGRRCWCFRGRGRSGRGWGRELAGCSPVFAGLLAECGRVLAPYTGWDLLEVIGQVPGAPALDRVDVVQPVSWAVMVGLAGVWQALGCGPDAVVGHSQGEIAAACVAGVLSLEDAAKVVAVRSQADRGAAGRGRGDGVGGGGRGPGGRAGGGAGGGGGRGGERPGGRWWCRARWRGAWRLLARVRGRRGAGPADRGGLRLAHRAGRGAARGDWPSLVPGSRPGGPVIPFYSTVTGQWLDGPAPARGTGSRTCAARSGMPTPWPRWPGPGTGASSRPVPHPVLTAAEHRHRPTERQRRGGSSRPAAAAGGGAGVTPGTLRRGDGGPARLLHSAASLCDRGGARRPGRRCSPGRVPGGSTCRLTRSSGSGTGWRAAGRAGDVVAAGVDAAGHPLLGAVVPVAGGQGVLFAGRLSAGSHRWLGDHRVGGVVLLPGAALVELVVRAGDEAGCPVVDELVIESAVVVPDEGVQVQVLVGAADGGGRCAVSVTILVLAGVSGCGMRWGLRVVMRAGSRGGGELGGWPPAGASVVDLDGFYGGLATAGYEYGPGFRGLEAVWRRGEEVFAEVALPDADGFWGRSVRVASGGA